MDEKGSGAVSASSPVVSQPVEINRPPCPMCGTAMFVIYIFPDEKPDHDQRTFGCPDCKHEEVRTVKFRVRPESQKGAKI
jgi:hypothetical protein